MLTIGTDKKMSFNRGDKVSFTFNATDADGDPYTFLTSDVLTLNIVKTKKYTNGTVFTKDFIIETAGENQVLELTADETKSMCEMINEPLTLWYEIVLNDDETLVGYDADGAKLVIIYPEGGESA